MKILSKILSFVIVFILMTINIGGSTYTIPQIATSKPIRAAVFLYNLNDLFISDVKKILENVQQENKNKIEFTFFDSKGDQVIENENIDLALDDHFNFFVINPITTKKEEIQNSINKIVHANIPFILYLPSTPSVAEVVKSSPQPVIIAGDVEQGGALQGKILADIWNANRETLDKNKDGIMQYVMLQGTSNYTATIARTKNSIREINDAGIKTQELLSTACNWNKHCAKNTIESALLTIGNKIEAIICNNDEMAIGAIEILQKYGFNRGNSSTYIPVVGIGGSSEAKNLIDEGIMAGTVIEDINTQSDAIYSVGMNLASGKDPLEGTNFKFDETGYTIKVPYYEYTKHKS